MSEENVAPNITINIINRRISAFHPDKNGFGLVDIITGFKDQETQEYVEILVSLPIAYDPNWTYKQIEERAFQKLEKFIVYPKGK